MSVAISVESLSKAYRIGQITSETLRQDVGQAWARLRGRADPLFDGSSRANLVWSLKDVSLSVAQGSAVGIIGRNGAGKSTLLKILSRVTSPTAGRIRMRGTFASLLEVGTGFHPELTGRENVFLNGAILGMRKTAIAKLFDEIVAFSGVERYIDTPVKRYSSGMYVRLAFAVAAHFDSDILLLDEVLAVGDAEFQKKCFTKLNHEARTTGRTILFVSHNHHAVRQICQQGVLLDRGRVVEVGPVASVLRTYLGSPHEAAYEVVFGDDTRHGTDSVRLRSIRILDERHLPIEQYWISKPHVVEIAYEVRQSTPVKLSLRLLTEDGGELFASLNNHEANYYGKVHEPGHYKSYVTIPGDYLNAGSYSVSINSWMAHQDNFVADAVFSFVAHDDGILKADYLGPYGSYTRPRLAWTTLKG